MKKKILIIQHHGKFGGASKSISEFILQLKNEFNFDIICPNGSTYNFFKFKKFKVYKFFGIPSYDITEIGSYTGFRKILLLRELLYLIIFFYEIIKIKGNKYDLVHLNDTNLIIIAPLLKYFFKSKIICHLRTRVDKKKLPKLILFIINNYVDKLICIDESTYSTSPNKKKSTIIYNIFKKKKSNKISLNKNKNLFYIGFLGSLDFHKGLDFYFDCISEINKSKNNFFFLIGGSLSVSNQIFLKISEFLKIKKNFNKIFFKFKNKNYSNVKFLKNVKNLDKFYQSIDLICFPSRMNALGRPVIEAASYSIPSIVCLDKYFKDTIIDNKSGYVVKFGDKINFIKKLKLLSKNKNRIKQMGLIAKKNYKLNHNLIDNIKKMSELYKSL